MQTVPSDFCLLAPSPLLCAPPPPRSEIRLTGTGEPGIPPGRSLHNSGPENWRPAGQLGQGLGVSGDGGRIEIHPRGGQSVQAGQAGEQVGGGGAGHGSPQDVADAVRRAQRDLRIEAAQRGRFEAGRALQGVGEEGGLHLGHVVQRGQRRTAEHEGALAVSLHLPHG